MFWSCIGASAQNTIHVPVDQPTIQAGIDAAVNGDTVLVAPGTYAESLDFKGKNITVTSGAKTYADAGAVILQQVGSQAVASFRSGEKQSAVLNGFTIQNGQDTMISVSSSSPTISNNVLSNITGCGIVITGPGGDPVVQGNHISAMKLRPLMRYCSVGYGSAIVAANAGNVSILENTVDNADITNPGPGNSASLVYFTACDSVLLENNIFRDNQTQASLLFIDTVGTFRVVQNSLFNNLLKSTDPISFRNIAGPLIRIESEPDGVMFPKAMYALLQNNTFANNSIDAHPDIGIPQIYYQIVYPDIGPFPPVVSENNLFISTSRLQAASCRYSKDQPTTYSYNDTFNAGVVVLPTDCTSTGTAVANIDQDPQFLNLAGGEVRIAHTSPAVYAGDINAPSIPAADLAGKNRTVCGKIDMGAYQTHPNPPITLTANPNPVAGGSVVTFSAQVTGNCNIPTGDLTFLDNGTTIGIGTLNSSAVAALSTAFLTVGAHHVTATYPGDFNFEDGISNTFDLTVTGLPTATSVTAAPNPAKAFQPTTFTANVIDPYVAVTGTVTFTAGPTTLGTAPLIGGVAAITTSQLGAGIYTVTATFNATTQFATSSASVQLQVDGDATTTALRSSLNPSLFGQAVTFDATVALSGSTAIPQGTVTFRDGAMILGTGSLDATGATPLTTNQLTVGSHSITAQYGGSTNANSSASPILIQVVNPASTTVTLTGTPNPASIGLQVTLTASVAGNLAGAPSSGTVTFTDQNGTIGTAAVNAGSAVLSISTLVAGTHTITATFLPSGVFGGGTSQPFTEVIQSFDFTITLSNPTVSMVSGASSTLTAQIQGVGNVTGNVALTAANVPQPANLDFKPASVSFAAGGYGNSVLTLTTASLPHASLLSKPSFFRGSSKRILAALALTPLLFVRRRRIRTTYLLLTGLISLACISGCTDIYYPVVRLAPGMYIIPITGIDQTSKIAHTVNLTLNITR